jgi:hypothetical protein
MKKFIAILAIATSVVACKGGEATETTVDSAKIKDSIAKVEAEAKMKADSAMSAVKVDSTKKDSVVAPAAPAAH